MTVNYHTHTYRCGHAVGKEREYVEKAIELGFSELGFSEHAPMPFPDGLPAANLERLLSMRLKTEEAEEHFATLVALREEYKNDIKIHIGLEVEYFEEIFDDFLEYIKDFPVEYFILGQHFSDLFVEPIAYYGNQTRSDAALKRYVDCTLKGLKTGKFTYLAHPDLIFYRRNLGLYESEMTRIVECAKENDVPLEINFYGLQEVRNYPCLPFWQIANSIGCDVVFGSDAHHPDNLKNPYALKHAELMLDNFKNLNLLTRVEFKKVN